MDRRQFSGRAHGALRTVQRWEAAPCQNRLLCSKRDTGQMPGGPSQPKTLKETVTVDPCTCTVSLPFEGCFEAV